MTTPNVAALLGAYALALAAVLWMEVSERRGAKKPTASDDVNAQPGPPPAGQDAS